MRFARHLLQRLRKDDGGFSLVFLATILVLLLGMAGFATDLGWIYLNTVRTQNAVDAAALAGVVNLPGFDPAPDAEAAARANGYDPGGADTLTLLANADNQLHAELSTSIEPFFMKIFGFTHFDITRQATAEYVKPVPLGSPSNCFGGGNKIPDGTCTGEEDFWAAVSGRRSRVEDGDPYSTLCNINAPGPSCSSANPNYARAGAYQGYYYGVDVPNGTTSLNVSIFDAGFRQRNPIGSQTGDSLLVFGGDTDINTTFSLYPPDTTPLIPQDHGAAICSINLNPGSPGTIWDWTSLCGGISNPTPGIWLVHVETTNNSSGSNNFAIKATGNPTSPQVFGINDMSIWSNNLSGASELYLAEIGEEHAGKKLELAFYDAGDANGESWYYVKDPFGNVPTCSWTVWDYRWPLPSATQVSNDSGACQWQTQVPGGTGSGVYNKEWIVATIDLPDDPADMCYESGDPKDDCFWKMDLDLSQPTERTTWQARVIGNPVRLLP
jgi:hypothetical protein